MPEEKYGDIDVNPIETQLDEDLDSKITTPQEAPVTSDEKPELDNVVPEVVVVEEVAEVVADPKLLEEPAEVVADSKLLEEPAEVVVDPKLLEEPAETETVLLEATTVQEDKKAQSKKPKSKKRIIFGAIALTVVAGCGVAAYFYSLPEKVAADAITGYIKQANKQMHMSGSIEIKPHQNNESASLLQNIRLDFQSDTNHFNNNVSVNFNLAMQGGQNINFSLNAYVQENGVIYLNVDKLKDAFNKATSFMPIVHDGQNGTPSILGLMQKAIGTIEGKWWRINVNETVNAVGDNGQKMDQKEKEEVVSRYNCFVREVKKDLEQTDKVADSYRKSPFLAVKPANVDDLKNNSTANRVKETGMLYQASIDSNKLFEFIRDKKQLAEKSGISSCFEEENSQNEDPSLDDSRDSDKTKEDHKHNEEEVKKLAESLKNVYLGVDFFTHQLKSFFIYNSDKSYEFSGAISFDQNKAFAFNAPSNSRPITDLVNDLTKDLGQDIDNLLHGITKEQSELFGNFGTDAEDATNQL